MDRPEIEGRPVVGWRVAPMPTRQHYYVEVEHDSESLISACGRSLAHKESVFVDGQPRPSGRHWRSAATTWPSVPQCKRCTWVVGPQS